MHGKADNIFGHFSVDDDYVIASFKKNFKPPFHSTRHLDTIVAFLPLAAGVQNFQTGRAATVTLTCSPW